MSNHFIIGESPRVNESKHACLAPPNCPMDPQRITSVVAQAKRANVGKDFVASGPREVKQLDTNRVGQEVLVLVGVTPARWPVSTQDQVRGWLDGKADSMTSIISDREFSTNNVVIVPEFEAWAKEIEDVITEASSHKTKSTVGRLGLLLGLIALICVGTYLCFYLPIRGSGATKDEKSKIVEQVVESDEKEAITDSFELLSERLNLTKLEAKRFQSIVPDEASLPKFKELLSDLRAAISFEVTNSKVLQDYRSTSEADTQLLRFRKELKEAFEGFEFPDNDNFGDFESLPKTAVSVAVVLQEACVSKGARRLFNSEMDTGYPALKDYLGREDAQSQFKACLLYTSPSPRD